MLRVTCNRFNAAGPMTLRSTTSVGVLALLLLAGVAQAQRDDQIQHAPPEAFLEGDPLPYFGSENPWNRRFFTTETPPRIGQPQLLHLLEGRVEEAIALCRQRLETNGVDVESHYVLGLALLQQGQRQQAERSFETALALGLPPERLLLPIGEFTESLRSTAVYRRIAADSTGLIHGPLLGAVTESRARFWVRTAGPAEVTVRASTTGHFTTADVTGSTRTLAAADNTGVIELTGLTPGTRYRYQVLVNGREVPRSQEWQFRTFPGAETDSEVRIAFGGCAKYFPDNERMWDTIRLRRPDALLLLGDNVYLTLPERTGPLHDYTYHQRQSRPEFRRLTATVPTYAIWDDHDAGIDDVFLGPYPDRPRWKVDYLELFRRNWNNPSYGAPDWPAVWHSVRVGPVECFMLDGRFYRENFLKPQPSMLGPVQKAWLLRALRDSTAPFKLLVSPVAWADDAKIERTPAGEIVHAKDLWSGYAEEREEIFRFIETNRIGGVILLSSDRHRSDVRIHERPGSYSFIELESGWLTNEAGTTGSGSPLFEYLKGPSFGFLTFQSGGGAGSAKLQLVTIDGEAVFTHVVSLSDLQVPSDR
jgi:alkaline phosphatase D